MNTIEEEPTEREWRRVFEQGREAFRKGLTRGHNIYRGGWQQDAWIAGFDAGAGREES